MLNESSGTPDCRRAVDGADPTVVAGYVALETEACQLVDRIRGVRVCRQLSLVTCSPQEWRCRNGLCVPAGARCDGAVQCYDKSDETHCGVSVLQRFVVPEAALRCVMMTTNLMNCDCDLTKQFRCGHFMSCFPNNKLCDGVIDCWDGFDEVNCTSECPEDHSPAPMASAYSRRDSATVTVTVQTGVTNPTAVTGAAANMNCNAGTTVAFQLRFGVTVMTTVAMALMK